MARTVNDDNVVVERDTPVVASDRGAGRGTTFLTWVALLIASLALILAWMAYERTGADLDSRIREGVNNATQKTEDAIDRGPDGVDNDDTETTTPPAN